MKKSIIVFLIMSSFVAFSEISYAGVDLFRYAQTLRIDEADANSRSIILGIMGSCGTASELNDTCTIEGLNRVAVEENNTFAASIVRDYQNALSQGNTQRLPECQIESHLQANKIIGHCLLLMNYYALNELDRGSAISQYEMCLQGGMLGLVYQGNIVAQYLIGSIYDRRGLAEPAQVWKKAILLRKNTPEFEMLMRCYR